MYIYNNELVNYKITIFVLVRIEIEFWHKIINNFNMICSVQMFIWRYFFNYWKLYVIIISLNLTLN